MKVISFLFLVLFLCSSCKNSSANIELQNENEVRMALSSRWETTYMETTGSRTKVPEEQVSDIVFNKNGTYSSGVKNGVITNKGEWNYEPKTQMLYIDTGKEKGPERILKLTRTELIMAEFLLLNEKIVDSVVVTYKKI
jgi:hypothetical protein